MPIISGGGGGGAVFNGGTITNPLIIDLTTHADAVALALIGAPGGSNDLLQVQDGSGTFGMEVFQSAGHASGTAVTSLVANTEALFVNGSGGTANALSVAAGGPTEAGYDKDARPFSNPVAPATVQLVTATGARISTSYDVELHTPVTFNPGVATTATCTVAISPDNITYTTLAVVTKPVGTVFDGEIDDVVVSVPKAWYVKLTVNAQATLGLSTYF